MRALALLLVALPAACGAGGAPGADAGPDAAPVVQGSPAGADLVINELSPRPAEGADWVELLNRSDAPIDLTGAFLTDNPDRLDHYLPLAGELAPGELLVVEPGEAFGLGVSDQLHIIGADGLPGDGLAYLMIGAAPGQTLARLPSGQGAFRFAPPTPGEPN